MDLYGGLMNLVKVASLLRGDPRSAYLVNEMQNERNENRVRDQIYGPARSNGIVWNGPRQMQSGNVSMGSAEYPDFAYGGNLPPVPKAFIPEVRKEAIADRKQQLMGIPAYQRMAENLMFQPPKPPIQLVEGAKLVDDTGATVADNPRPKNPWDNFKVAGRDIFQLGADGKPMLAGSGSGDVQLKPVFDRTAKQTRFATEDEIVKSNGNLQPVPSGMKFQSDGNGGFTFSQGEMTGESSPLTNKMTSDVQERLLKSNEGYARLQSVASQYKPEFQQLGTRWSSFATALKDKAGMPVDPVQRQQLEQYSAYRADAIDNLNQYIKDVTGAAMSIPEGQRITKGVPNPGQGLFDGDSPIEFKSKMDATMKRLAAVQARSSYALKHGLTQQQMFALPLESVPQIIDQRGDEIASELKQSNPNMSPDQIEATVKTRLRQEFGLQ